MRNRLLWLVGLALLAGALLTWWLRTETAEGGPRADLPAPAAPARPEPPAAAQGAPAWREPVAPATAPSPPVHDIEVLVHDERGQPVPGASLVVSRDGEEWLSEAEVPASVVGTTDTAGRAMLRDVASECPFVAAVKQGLGASAFCEVSDKGRVELTLATCDTDVRGRIVDHLGRGVAGIDVALEHSVGITCWAGFHRPVADPLPVRRRVVSASDGSFAFRASRTWGSCLLYVRKDRLRYLPVFADPGADPLRLELPGRAVVRGVVLDWRGEPVPDCEVWAGEPGFEFCFDTSTGSLVTADAAGRFEMPFLKGGHYVITPLGTATSPAGAPVKVDVAENAPGWIELRTAEPASLPGKVVGMRGRPTRIVAKPNEREEGRSREVLLAGDGEFVLQGLMRGATYDVIAYQDGDEVARGWARANGEYAAVLRNVNAGGCVLACRLEGDGLQAVAGKQVRIAVHPVDERTLEPRLAEAVTAVAWRGEREVRFDDLPKRSPAVAVLMVDGVERARSEPFRLGAEAATATIELRADGAIDVEPAPGKRDWCAWILRADGSEIVGRRGRTWQDAGESFRCSLPAGDYVLQVACAGDRTPREGPFTVSPGKTKYLQLP